MVLVAAGLVVVVMVVERGGRSTTAVSAVETAAAAGCGSKLCWMKASESGVIWRSAGRLLYRQKREYGHSKYAIHNVNDPLPNRMLK